MAVAQGAAGGAAAGASFGPIGAIVGGSLGALGGFLGARSKTKFRRRQRKAISSARKFADETVERITGGELFSSANEFLTSSFRDTTNSPLAQDFAKSIRAAQSVRGTFSGNLGAAQESFGVSGFAQKLKQSLLPQAQNFAFAPERLRQSILAQEAPLRVAAATGGSIAGVGPQGSIGSQFGGALSQGVAGGLGGFQIGSAIDAQNRFQTQLDALRNAKSERGGGGQGGGGIAQGQSFLDQRIQQFSGFA